VLHRIDGRKPSSNLPPAWSHAVDWPIWPAALIRCLEAWLAAGERPLPHSNQITVAAWPGGMQNGGLVRLERCRSRASTAALVAPDVGRGPLCPVPTGRTVFECLVRPAGRLRPASIAREVCMVWWTPP